MPVLVGNNLWFGCRGNGARVGPYAYGGDLFTVLLSTTSGALGVWKSSDSGATWGEVDAANHPSVPYNASSPNDASYYQLESYAVDTISSYLYVAYYTGTPAAPAIRVRRFNMATSAWSMTFTGPSPAAVDLGTVVGPFRPLYIACRGVDDFVLIYFDIVSSLGVTKWTAYAGGTWTGSGTVSDGGGYSYWPLPIVQGATGVQIVYNNASLHKLRYRVLDALNSLSASQIIGDGDANTDTFGASYATAGDLIAPVCRYEIEIERGPEGGPLVDYPEFAGNPTYKAAVINAGNQASFADIDNLNPVVQRMVWMQDISDYATRIWTSDRNRTSGVWTPASLVLDVTPNRLTDVFVRAQRVLYGLAGPTYIFCAPSRASAVYTMELAPSDEGSSLSLACGSPPGGTVGVPYSHTLLASGGTVPYTFSLAGGSLPSGLSLNASTGGISGTPTAAGTYSFTVHLIDSASNAANVTCSITIVASGPAFAANCGSPPGGVAGVPYTHTMFVSGGSSPYGWAIVGGSLPPGLALNSSTGALTGTPTLAGSYPFTVRVTDDDANAIEFTCSIAIVDAAATLSCSITVVAPESGDVSISCGSPPTGIVGTPYTHTLPIISPSGYTVAVTSGALPGGLTVAPTTGVVSGTPFESGIFPVTISLTHSSTTVTVDCTFRVYAPGTLRANCNDPEPATIGVAYEHSLGAAGGRPPYIWEITSGSLPTGLSMDSSGTITGTPTTAGTSTFTGRVTDADDTTASVTCSITVETPNSQGGSEGVCEVDDQGGPG